MKKQMKRIVFTGALAVLFLNADAMIGHAAANHENTEYESMSLIQNGSFQIPQENYNFEKNEEEGIYSYKAAENDGDTIAYKQKKAQEIRSDNEETLPERKAQCARVLYDGMVSLDRQIEVAQFALTTEEFKEVISDVVNSNPELFYIRNGYRRSAFALSDTDSTEIVDYCCGFYEYQDEQMNPQKDKINSLIAQVETVKDRILSDVIVSGMSNMEKALMIHEYLVLNTQYNYDAYLEYEKDGNDSGFVDSDYDIYGTLIKGQAVCQGYALSYKYLLESAGVENIGFASSKDHIWNTITLDGAAYYVDCTWDDTNWDTLGNVKHTYFLKNEDNFKNHVILEKDRICNGTAYDNVFWDNVDSGIFYYRGAYYYIKDDGYFYKIKLRTFADEKNGETRITSTGLKTTSSWNYGNAAKIAVAGSNIIFHDSSRIYCYNLRNGKIQSICEPALAENELIYGLRYQNGTFEYATRKQSINGTDVQYNNEEQKIYTYQLPESLFRVPVESVTVSGSDTIRLSMKDGKYINDTIMLKADILPEDADDKRIWKWTSSDTSVAVADINGKVKGSKPGTVTITAIAKDGRVEGTHNVRVVFDGWIEDESGSTVYYEDGKRIENRFYQIDGVTYYLGANGTKVTGWQKINGQQYYFREAGLYVTGWQTIDEKEYYFSKDGVMLTGWQNIDGKRYYFTESGIMLTGWQKMNGQQYYFGNKGIMVTGWNTIGKKRYYFDKKGEMITGWKTISKKKYYFDEKGVMAAGWKTIKKKKYYFSSTGVMQTGWKTIKKKKYYFDKKGVMATGWKTIKKKKYYFDKKGVMATGWKTIKKKKYYFNKKGVMQTGLKKINGISYYFARDGHLVS